MSAGDLAPAAGWLGALAVGFSVLLWYDGAAGREADPPARWPAASQVAPAPGRFTLVMLLHPGCTCSRASLRELEKILARAGDQASAYVLFVGPVDDDVGLGEMAAAIPGVTVLADAHGAEARRFGAATSGELILYDPGGAEVFHGGVTGARAHEGDNAGARTVVNLLTRGAAARSRAPVFGCALPEDRP